jgi:hypothetical protein
LTRPDASEGVGGLAHRAQTDPRWVSLHSESPATPQSEVRGVAFWKSKASHWLRRDSALFAALFYGAFVIRVLAIDWGLPAQNLPHSQFNYDETFELHSTLLLLGQGVYQLSVIKYQPFFYFTSVPFFVLYYIAGLVSGHFSGWQGYIGQIGPDLSHLYVAGRVFIVIAGSLTVSFVYVLGARLFDRRVGLVGAVFLLVSFGHVIYSRIYRLDSFMPLMVTLALYFAARLSQARPQKLRPFVLAGLAAAFAATTKVTGLSMLLPLVAYPLVEGQFKKRLPFARLKWDRRYPFALTVSVASILALTAPYIQFAAASRAGSGTALSQTTAAVGAVSQGLSRRFTAASATSDSYALSPYEISLPWHLSSSLPGQLSWPVFAPALGGLAMMLVGRQHRRQAAYVVIAIVAFMVPLGFVKRVPWRDTIPILPVLALCAGYGLIRLGEWLNERLPGPATGRRTLALSVLLALLTLIQPAASIWRHTILISRTDTRFLAQQWIEGHIPAGSRLALEPFGPPVLDSGYSTQALSAFDDGYGSGDSRPTYELVGLVEELGGAKPPEEVLPYLVESEIDYVIVSSAFYGRFYGAGLLYHAPDLADMGQEMHDVLASTLKPLVQFVPNWRDTPGPVIQIYAVPDDIDRDATYRRGAFEPFPGMERPASAVGYYQFQPWQPPTLFWTGRP